MLYSNYTVKGIIQMKNNKNNFTTGEFAKICNVNKQTLIYYDKIGLFSPNIKAENGYRYYSIHQYELFSVIELLKELGMSLNAIQEFIKNKSPEYFLTVMQQQKEKITQKKKQLEIMEIMIDTQILLAKQAETIDFSSITLMELKNEKLYLGDVIRNNTEEEFVKAVSHFVKEINEKKLDTGYPIGVVINKDSLLHNKYNHYSQLYIKQFHDVPFDDKIQAFSGTFLVGYHVGSEVTIYQTYERINNEMKRLNLAMGAFALEEYIFDSLMKEFEKDYVTKIMLQVKSTF